MSSYGPEFEEDEDDLEDCRPCAHGGTHGADYCIGCEHQMDYEGEAYCAYHDGGYHW